jgi:hypothetical protein
MFPSPLVKYFLDCAAHPECKPHLCVFAKQIFADLAHQPVPNSVKLSGGVLFTRFMIAGFATYQTLARLGAAAFEGYPYLAFRLWMNQVEKLPPKKYKSVALELRKQIVHRLATKASIEAAAPFTLDQADGAILAITVAAASAYGRVIGQIAVPPEGRFLVALDQLDSNWLEQLPLGEKWTGLTSAEANRFKED